MTEFNFLTRRRCLWRADAEAFIGRALTSPSSPNLSPKALIEGGQYQLGDTEKAENNPELATRYWEDGKGSVSHPYADKGYDLWFLTESVRWEYSPQRALREVDLVANKAKGEKFWREAAQKIEIAQADISQHPTRGAEKFFDGVEFDPIEPQLV